MPELNSQNRTDDALGRVLLWDLAGTLLVHDETSHRSGPLPGWETALPSLASDFRMAVATGEGTSSARNLLSGYGLMPFFEEIFGDLLAHGGKPHGEILRQLGGRPELSLAIGDRLQSDVPGDCENLVTLIVNQNNEILNGELIANTVRAMQKAAPTMPDAFRELAERATPDPEVLGPHSGGLVSAAWRSEELSGARLWIFEPDWVDSRRAIILV
jgi:hypothetical protein